MYRVSGGCGSLLCMAHVIDVIPGRASPFDMPFVCAGLWAGVRLPSGVFLLHTIHILLRPR